MALNAFTLSLAKQGISAFVPSRSLTLTKIIGSEGGAGLGGFLIFLSGLSATLCPLSSSAFAVVLLLLLLRGLSLAGGAVPNLSFTSTALREGCSPPVSLLLCVVLRFEESRFDVVESGLSRLLLVVLSSWSRSREYFSEERSRYPRSSRPSVSSCVSRFEGFSFHLKPPVFCLLRSRSCGSLAGDADRDRERGFGSDIVD